MYSCFAYETCLRATDNSLLHPTFGTPKTLNGSIHTPLTLKSFVRQSFQPYPQEKKKIRIQICHFLTNCEANKDTHLYHSRSSTLAFPNRRAFHTITAFPNVNGTRVATCGNLDMLLYVNKRGCTEAEQFKMCWFYQRFLHTAVWAHTY